MGWRSLVVANPATIGVEDRALVIGQHGNRARIMLEDVSVVVLDHPQIKLTAPVLSACADAQIAVIVVGASHLPSGVLLPHHPHSRALKVMTAQLALGLPARKRLRQRIVQFKIRNQAAVLAQVKRDDDAHRLRQLSLEVRSGDPTNCEAQAAQIYFRTLVGSSFRRSEARFYNAALNYGYAVMRAAIARTLTSYGFLPSFGLFHRNEQNNFNLADDLLEPYRPLMDVHVLTSYPEEPERDLEPADKGVLVSLLHHDVVLSSHAAEAGRCTMLAAIDATVSGLSGIVVDNVRREDLPLPVLVEASGTVGDKIDEDP